MHQKALLMAPKKIMLIAIITFFCSQMISAQEAPVPSTLPAGVLNMYATPAMPADQTAEAIEAARSKFIANFKFELIETNNIAKIHLKLGTSDGAADLLNKTFIYSNTGTVDGITYTSEGNTLLFSNAGEYNFNAQYFAQVVIEKADGSLSAPIKYSVQF